MSLVGLGGLARRRPDQQYRPEQGGVTPGSRSTLRVRSLIVQGAGGGEFVYDAAGNLIYSNVGADTVDPLHRQFVPRGVQIISAVSGQIMQFVDGQIFFSVQSSVTKGKFADSGQGSTTWQSSTFGAGDAAGTVHLNSKNVSNDGSAPELAASNRINIFMGSVAQAFGIAEQTDAFLRYTQDTNGKTGWGDGTGPVDSLLYRVSAGLLAADDIVANKGGSAETWQSMAARGYQNSWSDTGGNSHPGRFRLVSSPALMVQVQGSILIGSANPPDGQVVVNVPLAGGYRPPAQINNFSGRCIVPSNAAVQVRFNITAGGNITVAGASGLGIGTEIVFPDMCGYSLD